MVVGHRSQQVDYDVVIVTLLALVFPELPLHAYCRNETQT